MNNIFLLYRFLNANKLVNSKLIIFLTTLITLFNFAIVKLTKAQTITRNNTQIIFYGSEKKPTVIGGEYIIFQANRNLAQGLLYIQNSGVFSCFQGNYDSQNQSLEQVIFAYPEMGTDKWVQNKSAENISLEEFPHQLDYIDVNDNSQQLFNQCLKYFGQN